jgi:hypothetical protein
MLFEERTDPVLAEADVASLVGDRPGKRPAELRVQLSVWVAR